MTMFLDIEGHVAYALRNAQVKNWPFPHFFAENVFPEDFYRGLVRELAQKDDFQALEGRYNGRTFGKTDEFAGLAFMHEKPFLKHVCHIFKEAMQQRFKGEKTAVYHDLRLVRDGKGYSIGPHTDASWKVVSLLFYLPEDSFYSQCGTSLYLPKIFPEFTCPGGPHHDFADFKRIYTAPYIPNSCFGFFKTDNSFHGVEPLEYDFRRDVLLYNVYEQQAYLQSHKPSSE